LPGGIRLAFDDNREDNTCHGVAGLTKAGVWFWNYKNASIINTADISRVHLVDLLFLLLPWQEGCN
jgi:hypothetical protein